MQTVKMLSTKQFEQWLQEQAEIAVRYRKIEKSALLWEDAPRPIPMPLS